MHEWTNAENLLIGELERDLCGGEMRRNAVVDEWVKTNVHRVFAVTAVLGAWRTQLLAHEFPESLANASLPLIMDRLWPVRGQAGIPLIEILDSVADRVMDTILSDDDDFDFEDDDETED